MLVLMMNFIEDAAAISSDTINECNKHNSIVL